MKATIEKNLFALARYGYTWDEHIKRETCSMTQWETADYLLRLQEEFKELKQQAHKAWSEN
jgi:hypothetical protein